MADTTLELDAGSGGATLAVDDIAGAVYQYVGMTYGGSGSKTAVSNTNPMPVKISDGTDVALVNGSGELTVKHADAIPVTDNGGSLTVDGTVAVTNAGLTALNGAIAGTEVQVDVLTMPTTTVTGTVTANLSATDNGVLDDIAASVAAIDTDTTTLIGHVDGIETLLGTTNTNTGNAATSLAVIDDWDESDRAKVNIVAGQAGITAGAGAVGASTPRVTLASDDPGVALLTTIDGDTGSIATASAAIQTAAEAIQAAVEGTLTVTGGGGGTEYTEGDTDATITGGVMMMEGAANTVLPVQGTVSDGLLVNLGGNNDVTVTGTVDLGATDNAVLDDIAAKLATIDADTSALFGTVAGTEVQVDVVGALPAGTNAIGKLAANSGVDIGDVDVTSISAGTNLIGDVGIQGRTTGGLSIFRSIDLDESEEEIKGSAGTLYSILAFNRTAAPLYLKFYDNTAAGTTVGSTTPVMTFVVPANADSDGAGFTHACTQGYAFSTGITAAATTAIADADTGAPGANDCVIVVGYK